MENAFRPHVLVVDDDASVREALSVALRPAYDVHTAATGAEAYAVLRAHAVALILLDIFLQHERGLELIEPFRRVSAARILVLTGHGSEAVAADAVWAKADGYLPKPVSLPTLRAAVERLVPPLDVASRARQALETSFARPFHAQRFAKEFGVSEPHLRWLFRQAYGKTPHQYRREVQLQQAATLLRTSDQGIERIAFEVGFPDVTWFAKLFKRTFGLTPAAFRTAERATDR